jgi:acetyl-CoA C-acetyltransferase
VARSAYITGWAHSPFGKLEDPDTEGLMARVLRPALDHAQMAADDVDGVFVGIMNNGFQKQDLQGAIPGHRRDRCIDAYHGVDATHGRSG